MHTDIPITILENHFENTNNKYSTMIQYRNKHENLQILAKFLNKP